MPVPSLIDEINRLFDEMIRTPWSQSRTGRAGTSSGGTALEIEIPLGGGQPGDISVSIAGQRLTVGVRRRPTRATGSEGGPQPDQQEQFERSLVLPDDADVSAIEARFEGDVLRVRIGLRHRSE